STRSARRSGRRAGTLLELAVPAREVLERRVERHSRELAELEGRVERTVRDRRPLARDERLAADRGVENLEHRPELIARVLGRVRRLLQASRHEGMRVLEDRADA